MIEKILTVKVSSECSWQMMTLRSWLGLDNLNQVILESYKKD